MNSIPKSPDYVKEILTKHVYSVKIFCGKLYLTVLCVTVNILDSGEGFF